MPELTNPPSPTPQRVKNLTRMKEILARNPHACALAEWERAVTNGEYWALTEGYAELAPSKWRQTVSHGSWR